MEIYKAVKRRWDSIAKPIDGLGDFEDIICKIGSVRKTDRPSIDRKVLVIMCADNGIVEEGVSQCGFEVTFQVASALGAGTSTANVMAAEAGVTCIPVDIGIDHEGEIPGVRNMKIRRGTRDFLEERALTEEEASLAIDTGKRIVTELAKDGCDIIATGEMGIGNTTTATALLCLIKGSDPGALTGRGAGLSDEKLKTKISVVKRAVELYSVDSSDITKELALKYLCDIGGLDIAAMCGMYMGGMECGIPVVIDGLISAVAALLADIICPGCRKIMIPSHSGRETGLRLVLDELGLKPFINGNMALGEGTGAIMMLKLLDSAMYLYDHGAVFEDNGIKEYERYK
ncbi:MAG: nicotinate-nucleotide--dimethylbenzimidazole phosphoribosyltransferase [Lachnospiraceae bacterium]|nr:nicotinate-nucleotide--dimethylbenzimidazole phosphoribosyltransferase [Lachnospiraceae bacterium]